MSGEGRTRIVILGGGFAGLYAALHLEKALARDPGLEVTLVNRENFFLFTPMLHEVAASDVDAAAQRLRAGKVAFVSPGVVAMPGGELEFRKRFLVRDPDGHVMQVIE